MFRSGSTDSASTSTTSSATNSRTAVKTFPASSIGVTGGLASVFIDDKFKVTSWLTLIAGLRQSHFTADIVENATDPRVRNRSQNPALELGLSRLLRRLLPGPAAARRPPARSSTLANSQGFSFAPLHGERDEEHQFGVTIPYRGWDLDADTFQTRATNWLDHNNIGESNLFWPITWDAALIQGWELTLRSPRLWHHGAVSPCLCQSNRAGHLDPSPEA